MIKPAMDERIRHIVKWAPPLSGMPVNRFKKYRHRRNMLFLMTLLSCLFLLSCENSLPGVDDVLPELDFSGKETQVVEKIDTLREALRKEPGSAAQWGKLAMTLEVHDYQLAAIPCYKRAAALDSADFRWPFFLGIIFSGIGQPEALDWFDRAQRINPDDAPLNVLHGQALLNEGRPIEAAKRFENALVADPANSHAALGLAQICLARNDLACSNQQLLQAIAGNPQHGEAYGLLAEVYRRLGNPEAAEKARQKATEFPGQTRVHNPAYWAVIEEGVSAAWYQERGRTYLKSGNYPRAEAEFRSVLQLRPNAEDHNNLGIVLHNLKKYDEAIIQYRSAMSINPGNPELFMNLANAHAAKGENQRAVNMLRRADQLARAANRTELYDPIQQLLETYEQRQ